MRLHIANCFDGSARNFKEWRYEVARLAGLPPLDQMEGFSKRLADGTTAQGSIKWDTVTYTPLSAILNHSDREGSIKWEDADLIAQALLLVQAKSCSAWFVETTERWIQGLLQAATDQEDVIFEEANPWH